MAIRVILHVHNEDPIVAEVDDLPDPSHNYLLIRNPRKRDGKVLNHVTDGATAFIYPWTRITFVEIMDETQQSNSVVPFFREEGRIGRS
jgi:hypothetical protein